MDANPVCLDACANSQPILHPGSTVEWWKRDFSRFLTFPEIIPDTQTIIYVYVSESALKLLQPMLLSCVRRGARVVTFVNHLKTEFRVSSFGDILRMY